MDVERGPSDDQEATPNAVGCLDGQEMAAPSSSLRDKVTDQESKNQIGGISDQSCSPNKREEAVWVGSGGLGDGKAHVGGFEKRRERSRARRGGEKKRLQEEGGKNARNGKPQHTEEPNKPKDPTFITSSTSTIRGVWEGERERREKSGRYETTENERRRKNNNPEPRRPQYGITRSSAPSSQTDKKKNNNKEDISN